MQRRIDPRYTFHFVDAAGKPYRRQVYREKLYAFFPDRRPVLAAARVAPLQNMHYALFQVLKSRGREIHRALLPEVSREGDRTDFIGRITEMIHYRTSSPPARIIAEAREGLGEAMAQVLDEYGIRNWLGYVSNPGDDPPFEALFSVPSGMFNILAGITAEDAGWFNLSCRVQALVEDEVRRIQMRSEAQAEEGALVPASELEGDLYRRLYSNPKYLELVKRVMDAKGGYASPLVNHFVSFYARCLNQKIKAHSRREENDTDFLRERVEGILGKEEAGALRVLPVYSVIILGYVLEGGLPVNEDDPEKTGKSYQVDPGVALETVVLQEIEERVAKVLTRGFVWYLFGRNHRIKDLVFAGDL